jgi:hypothetical protein
MVTPMCICKQSKYCHYFVDGRNSDKQSKDNDKCLHKANMYEIDTIMKKIITVNVLREMILRANILICI